jgi:hypothetical protein
MMYSMPPISGDAHARAPVLRVRRGAGAPEQSSRYGETAASHAERPALHLLRGGAPLLIAGADRARAGVLLADLASTMPEGTVFEQASTLTEVLEQAAGSRMVILSGPLEDASARSLMRVLGQRHPTLPIINMDPDGPDDL